MSSAAEVAEARWCSNTAVNAHAAEPAALRCEPPDTGAVLTTAGRALDSDLDRAQSLVTAFLGYLRPAEHLLRWSDAGHGLAVVVPVDGPVAWLRSGDLPIGVDGDADWSTHSRRLAPGDRIVVFSDGVLDLVTEGAGGPGRSSS